MDSGKECSVQFWAPNGSNKLLESFLRASSLRSSFLCSWIDDFDVTLIMRSQSVKKYNQLATCTLYLQNICRLMSHLLIEFFSHNLRMTTIIDISILHNTLHLAQTEKVLQESRNTDKRLFNFLMFALAHRCTTLVVGAK